eukprot:SAG31_NODE_5061_length_2765_cov_3.097899_2_plen_57_part_00
MCVATGTVLHAVNTAKVLSLFFFSNFFLEDGNGREHASKGKPTTAKKEHYDISFRV